MHVLRCCGCVLLYVSFGSKVRPTAFGCDAIGSALFCILGPDFARIFCRVWREQSASCFVWIKYEIDVASVVEALRSQCHCSLLSVYG